MDSSTDYAIILRLDTDRPQLFADIKASAEREQAENRQADYYARMSIVHHGGGDINLRRIAYRLVDSRLVPTLDDARDILCRVVSEIQFLIRLNDRLGLR